MAKQQLRVACPSCGSENLANTDTVLLYDLTCQVCGLVFKPRPSDIKGEAPP